MVERKPNSCLIGDTTGILFGLHIKLFRPSVFKSVDFWRSMSSIVLDFEPAHVNFSKELTVLLDGKVQGYSFQPPKSTNPQKAFCSRTNLHGTLWNSECLDYSQLPSKLPRDSKSEYFARGTNKCKIFP